MSADSLPEPSSSWKSQAIFFASVRLIRIPENIFMFCHCPSCHFTYFIQSVHADPTWFRPQNSFNFTGTPTQLSFISSMEHLPTMDPHHVFIHFSPSWNPSLPLPTTFGPVNSSFPHHAPQIVLNYLCQTLQLNHSLLNLSNPTLAKDSWPVYLCL